MVTLTLYRLEINRPFDRGQRCHFCHRPTPVRRLATIARPTVGKNPRLRSLPFYICQRCKPLAGGPVWPRP